ncbi:hypothetical protein [Sphingobacterium sp. 1.A.4]|uniref:hypothetical protein n=1 Tax=Sphingobacterium sp. 1.A.4 TaxID=2044603 RepID=UPI000C0BD79E|nr:hypothetical protein [Sphingobacterium sp. 1.A.4]
MKTAIINHHGKRPFDFRIVDGVITYQWINYIDNEGMENSEIKAKEILKIEKLRNFQTKVFYN